MGAGMLVETGQAIKTSVREFFVKGHKSNNKFYDPDGPSVELRSNGWEEEYERKAAKRTSEADWSGYHRLSFKGLRSYYELAENLIKMAVWNRSGNCMEMAALSNYEAINTYKTNRRLCYLCFITAPADHACALISETPIMGQGFSRGTAFASVLAFTQAPAATKWLVIDPWLNTVCTADNYLQTGGQKLEEWTAKGKRILWAHGSVGLGYYPPGGSSSEYRQKFEIAPLEIAPF